MKKSKHQAFYDQYFATKDKQIQEQMLLKYMLSLDVPSLMTFGFDFDDCPPYEERFRKKYTNEERETLLKSILGENYKEKQQQIRSSSTS